MENWNVAAKSLPPRQVTHGHCPAWSFEGVCQFHPDCLLITADTNRLLLSFTSDYNILVTSGPTEATKLVFPTGNEQVGLHLCSRTRTHWDQGFKQLLFLHPCIVARRHVASQSPSRIGRGDSNGRTVRKPYICRNSWWFILTFRRYDNNEEYYIDEDEGVSITIQRRRRSNSISRSPVVNCHMFFDSGEIMEHRSLRGEAGNRDKPAATMPWMGPNWKP